jgi:zinc resistance-associated protein
MKGFAAAIGVILLIAALAVPVMAWGPGWGRGGHMWGGRGGGPGSCWQDNGRSDGLSQEQRTALEGLDRKFWEETAPLRESIRSKSWELNSVLGAENLNMEKARSLQKEVSELKATMAQKRLEYELEARKIAPDSATGRTYGKGYGKRGGRGDGRQMRGPGAGTCWN